MLMRHTSQRWCDFECFFGEKVLKKKATNCLPDAFSWCNRKKKAGAVKTRSEWKRSARGKERKRSCCIQEAAAGCRLPQPTCRDFPRTPSLGPQSRCDDDPCRDGWPSPEPGCWLAHAATHAARNRTSCRQERSDKRVLHKHDCFQLLQLFYNLKEEGKFNDAQN